MEHDGLHVTSEIGRLREVIVHTPGRELELVTPRNFGRMLMDDILYLPKARQGHECLVQLLEKLGVRVHQVRDLLHETLRSLTQEERRSLVETLCILEGCTAAYRERLHRLNPEGLTEVCIEGELQGESLNRALRQDIYALPPLSNMMFVRDGAVVMNRGVILSAMARGVRARESLLHEWIFRYHPRFRLSSTPPWLWLRESQERRNRYLSVHGMQGMQHLIFEGANFRLQGMRRLRVGSQEYSKHETLIESDDMTLEAYDLKLSGGRRFVLEGGNVFVLSENTLLIGCNDRTSPTVVDILAQELLQERSRIKTILVAVSSATRKEFFASHLDTGFAPLDGDARGVSEYLIHEPMVTPEGNNLAVMKITFERGHLCVEQREELKLELQHLFPKQKSPKFLLCGGNGEDPEADLFSRPREWHHQAVNVLALAPGKIIAFRRNHKTIEMLQAKGYQTCKAEDILTWDDEGVAAWWAGSKSLILLPDTELARAHGGPRSLVLPLWRDSLS